MNPRITKAELLALTAIVLFSIVVRGLLIDRPFHRDPEGCGSFYGLLGRNYWRYDLSQTLGVPVMSMGAHDHPTFYPNHPPLVPMLIAAALGIAGYTSYETDPFPPDWLIRLPTVPFTIGCVVLVWWLVRKSSSPRAALVAVCLFAAMPMTLVFGGLIDVIGTQLDFFVLLTIAAYLRLHATPSVKWLALMSAALFFAGLTDWPAFFIVPVLGVHFALTKRVREWPWILAFGVISIACFAIPYVQVVLVTHDWTWIKERFARRALSSVSDARAAFTFLDWVEGALYRHMIGRHGWVVIVLAFGWIVWAIARIKQPPPAARVTGLVLGWAILHVLVGRQGVFVHEWWWWPLTPGVAMAAGLMIDQLCRWYELPRRGLIDFRPVYTTAALLLGLVAFTAWNTYHAVAELRAPKGIVIDRPELDYTIDEIGAVIRAAAPPNAVVMLAENDPTLSLWYYADRPLRTNVWDPWTFEQRRADGTSELCFNLTERLDAPAAAFVFPKAYRQPKMEPLYEYLSSRFTMRELPKFYVFDLKRN